VEGLGNELQRRGITRFSQWGASGVTLVYFSQFWQLPHEYCSNHLTSIIGDRSAYPLKRPLFSSDVAVQTENVEMGLRAFASDEDTRMDMSSSEESTLSASDLASILQWSKVISSDINLYLGKPAYFMHSGQLVYIMGSIATPDRNSYWSVFVFDFHMSHRS
jgi:hypothetical protein